MNVAPASMKMKGTKDLVNQYSARLEVKTPKMKIPNPAPSIDKPNAILKKLKSPLGQTLPNAAHTRFHHGKARAASLACSRSLSRFSRSLSSDNLVSLPSVKVCNLVCTVAR